MKTKVTKAVILAAGQGTRFLPQTKAMPKEMLPLIDKPIIQYVVEEVVAAGVTDIIMVTGATKRSIEDHFDHQYELESNLDKKGKADVADRLRKIADMANFVYVRQKGGPGTAPAILCASHLIDDEPFLLLYGDDIMRADKPRAVQLVEAYEKYQAPVIALLPIDKRRAGAYGIVDPAEEVESGVHRIKGLVEKPNPADAPSNLASIGGYVLNRQLLEMLEDAEPDATGERYMPPVIGKLAQIAPVYGKVIDGTWHDCGNREKYLEAIADFALADPVLGPKFTDFLKGKLG